MIGVFGSAFNPPTKGHAFVIKEARKSFDRVLAVPSFDHCFGKKMAPFEVRMMLTKGFVSDLNDSNVLVSDIEKAIWKNQPVSSYEVLTALKERYPDDQIHLIIGQDNAEQFHRFQNADRIKQEFGVFVVTDAGPDYPRSTDVRKRLSESESVEGAVTESVEALLGIYHQHFVGI